MNAFDILDLLIALLIMGVLGSLIFILEDTPIVKKFTNKLLHIWDQDGDDL
nr:MAG TPA: Protein of unknown function (DUF1494) [Crassvirales sp.]